MWRMLLLLAAGLLGYGVYSQSRKTILKTPWPRLGDAPNAPTDFQHFHLRSLAFEDGMPIPAQYSGEADDHSPPLTIHGTPEGTRSLALIMEDPDTFAPPVFTHWLLWNIPPETTELADNRIPIGAIQGKNSLKNAHYNGPCPPFGVHHYLFRLYALDTMLDLPLGANKAMLQAAMKGHILAETALMGTYTANRTTQGNLFVSALATASKS